jgi:plasmid stability protein
MKMVQIRNVPDDLHRELRLRAIAAGLSLSDYLKQRLADMVERPTPAEWVQTLSERPMFASSAEIVDHLRADRDRP